MNATKPANEWAYIARSRTKTKHVEANQVCAVIVDCPEMQEEISESIAEWLRDDCTIERVPVEWVRKHFGSTDAYQPETIP